VREHFDRKGGVFKLWETGDGRFCILAEGKNKCDGCDVKATKLSLRSRA
jgi:hypothetical protein